MDITEHNLLLVLSEIRMQCNVRELFPPGILGFDDTLKQIFDFIEANECGIAYEVIVTLLEDYPFTITGQAAVRLLEVGLLFGYKTEIERDKMFDRRA